MIRYQIVNVNILGFRVAAWGPSDSIIDVKELGILQCFYPALLFSDHILDSFLIKIISMDFQSHGPPDEVFNIFL